MVEHKQTYKWYILFCMVILALCGCVAMQLNDGDIEDSESSLFRYLYLLEFILLLPGVFLYTFYRNKSSNSKKIFRSSTFLFFWMALITMLQNKANLNGLAFNEINVFMPLFLLYGTYYYSQKYGITIKSIANTSFVMMLIMVAQYFIIYNISDSHLISSYYPLFILPLILLHPSKLIKYSSIIIVTLVIFSSLKRGGFVALSLGLIVYLLSFWRVNSNTSGVLLYILFALLALGGIYYYLANNEYTELIERLMDIQNDEGSGRTDVWETTWAMISTSDTFPYIWGHGPNAVLTDSPLELSAHNDFLEAWYDYGFIGFCLYLIMLIYITHFTFRLISNKSTMAPSMAMTLTFMLILTMISHVLIFFFINFVCLTIGLIAGQNDYSLKSINEHNQ